MKIQYMSDIHCEFHADNGKSFCETVPLVGDVLVIAGDFATYHMIVGRLGELAKRGQAQGIHIIFVPGNHELYHTDRGWLHNSMIKLMHRFPNFHWLNKSAVEISGQRFLGGTMWFKYDPLNHMYEQYMGDFGLIRGLSKWVYDESDATVSFFKENIRKGDVVVTHHLPTHASVNEKYRGNQLNRFYVRDVSEVILDTEPKLWIHGHSHDAVDYMCGETRIVSNPHGYVGHEDSVALFREAAVIEV